MTRSADETRRASPAVFGSLSAAPAHADGAAAAAPPPSQTTRPVPAQVPPSVPAVSVAAPSVPAVSVAAPSAGADAGATATAVGDRLGRALAGSLASPPAAHVRSTGQAKHGFGSEPQTVRQGPAGRMPRLRIGRHSVSSAALARLNPARYPAGLVLGINHRHKPISIRFFQPEPGRISLVGGVWAGKLIAFRALAAGAQVTVVTAEPAAWSGLGQAALGWVDDRVEILAEPGAVRPASAQQPTLLIHDTTSATLRAALPEQPWQTRLTIVRHLEPDTATILKDSSFCLLQRLTAEESALAQDIWRLTQDSARFLPAMADDTLALVGATGGHYLRLCQTDMELQLLGPPRR